SERLIYTRFEALRCLALVRYYRSKSGLFENNGADVFGFELAEAARICDEAELLVGPTQSRVSKLWLGPVHIDVLLEQVRRAEAAKGSELATQKRDEAKSLL